MANQKISQLVALASPATGDLVPVVDVSEPLAVDQNKSVTFSVLTTYFNTNLSFAATSHTHTEDQISVSVTDRLVGRDTAGGGACEELTVSGGLEFTGTGGIRRSALTGNVTASAGSNATTIAANVVANTMLRDSAALSVIGRSANTVGDPGDISATVDGQVLRLSGTTLGFGTIATAGIADNAVTLAKMADVATGTVFYRKTAATGDPEVQTLATLKTDLGLTGTNSGDQTISLTGDVTGSGTGSFAATIADNAVTLAKMADVASGTVFYRKTAATGDPEVQTLATLKTDLALGDGTLSGLTDTNITTPADASFLIYDTGTATWRDFTLSGGVTCTDAGVTTVANDSHTHNANNLTGTTLAAGVTASSLTSVGTITTGVWTGTALGANYVPNHDSLNGFVANEHIDWTNTTFALTTTSSVNCSSLNATGVVEGSSFQGTAGGSGSIGLYPSDWVGSPSFTVYDGGHATQAYDVEYETSSGIELHYDDSASTWDFKANAITTTGTISGVNVTSGSNPGHTHTENAIQLSTNNVFVGRSTAGAGGAEELSAATARTILNVGDGANVSNTGTPLNDQIAVWTNATTVEGSTNLTYTATQFKAGTYVFNTDQSVGSITDKYVLTYDNASGEIGLEAPGGGGLTATYKTTNYTAVAGDFVVMEANGASKTVTLPATIAAGNRIAVTFRDGTNGLSSIYTCTIGRNAKTIRYGGAINGYAGGAADDITLAVGETIELIASDTSNWNVV